MVYRDRSDVPEVFLGNDLIDEREIDMVVDLLKKRSIFRYYGHEMLHRTDNFEYLLSKYFGSKYALCVSSGTAALKVAINSLDLDIGDEIILPSFGYIATANAIISSNCIPVFADVDNSLNISPDSIESLISEKTKAIIVIHISGQACDMEKIMEISERYNIPVIEDVAQAFGGEYKGRKLGTIGKIGCFSFQSNKLLSTGEGGCVITNDNKLYLRGRNYHDQGGFRKNNTYPKWSDNSSLFGENLRMTEIAASIGIVQLSRIDDMLDILHEHKLHIMKKLEHYNLNWRKNFDIAGDCSVSLCFYIDNLENREIIIEKLRGIHANGSYNSAMYENYVFDHIKQKFKLLSIVGSENRINIKNCKNAEKLSKEAVWIPLSPLYTSEDLEVICNKIEEILQNQN
ncbi:DegT/DnrJ/EryC1/StrS family aminotransferase [Enterococcus cecorum]|uniref:DegT/DnrJ/EryC1/StrS family aminotransferase n=2 Tax=Enterococcus cecorum TaxID=44008 RepID=UPI001FACC0FA|nr:DegT/DnrJ/EryC1/StrS family aminotransferase [Enterococcus cecorum]MCJ0538733.1 DegT/DnrJ/EryC1/StrS family aminotransferase [Enterococcus cecorum]MCJ0547218.1 DegT/DnrJ/EryC1/StrS family aminotransferase [Enterococcus cecorum]MCJ0551980.1 DegT/DnrJ/EryC1/StrS family aminotransferase [Enterococcus cecorum]